MSMELGSSNSYLAQPRHSWWSMLTTRERKLALACAIVSAVAIVFLISTIAVSSRARFKPDCVGEQGNKTDLKDYDGEICKTESCLNSVYYLRLYLDERNDPCEDFHAFACGNFHKIYKGYRNSLEVVQKRLYEEVNELLREPKQDSDEGATFEAHQLYEQCMQQENYNEAGLKILRDMLKEILRVDIPMVMGSKWNGQNFDWRQSVLKLLKGWSQDYLIPFNIFPSPANSTRYIPQLMRSSMQADFIFSDIPLTTNIIKKAICILYKDCVDDEAVRKDLGILTGKLQGENKTASSLGEGTFQRETAESVSWFVLSADPGKQPSFQEYEIQELQREVPQVKWQPFVETLLDQQIDQSFKIGTNLTYLNKAVSLMNSLDNRTAANMIGWIFIAHWGKLFSKELRETMTPHITQENLCFSLLNQVMGFAVGKMYVDKYVPSETIKEVEDMTILLQSAFSELISEADWMDEVTKRTAFKKVDNMKSSVGVPQWVLSEPKVNDYYKEIRDVKTLSFDKSFSLSKDHFFKQQLKRLTRSVDIRNDWVISSPVTTNAFYYLLSNAMFYYLGIIKEPLYSPGSPKAVRFGSFGTVAGHEISHGFDIQGKERDETGIERNWWTAESSKSYEEKAKCFVECYSNITDKMTKLKLDGKRTLSENIADSGGLRAAFKAFKSIPAEPKKRLKGFEDYTEEQVFFISAAQIWCSDQDVFSLARTILSEFDVHSPSKYRAIVPFQNDPEFSKAFKCNSNSPMNPRKKCSLW